MNKKIAKPFVRLIKAILIFIFSLEASLAKAWASSAHKRLFWAQWRILENPEFFDHHLNLYHTWQHDRRSHWLERGVFGSLALKEGGEVLELCCGDGFNSKYFYSGVVKNIISCDFDPKAIKIAQGKNSAPNLKFQLADIRHQMPEGNFDNIVWDAAIEHFTPTEIDKILADIKKRLVQKNGILSGFTIVERADGAWFSHHEYEFKNMEDLRRFFLPHFKNVIVFETKYPERHNLYFWASDNVIPFSEEWPHWKNK